jgi:hypothetical protein
MQGDIGEGDEIIISGKYRQGIIFLSQKSHNVILNYIKVGQR